MAPLKLSSKFTYVGRSAALQSIPLAAIINPFGSCDAREVFEFDEERISELRCKNCFAFLDNNCTAFINSTQICPLCEEELVSSNLKSIGLSNIDQVDIVSGISLNQLDEFSFILIIDMNLLSAQLNEICESVQQSILAIGVQKSHVALVTVSRVVTVYRCGLDGVVSGDVFGAIESFKNLPELQVSSYLVPAASCFDIFLSTILSLRGGRKIIHSGRQTSRRRKQFETLPRNLALAMEISIFLGSFSNRTTSRIVACLEGFPNVDSEGVSQSPVMFKSSASASPEELSQYQIAKGVYRDLGEKAMLRATAIDVFCSGVQQINSPILNELVKPTGGIVLLQQSFGAPEFGSNLLKMFTEQTITKGFEPTVEIICSEDVNVVHMIGPAECTEDNGHRHVFKMKRQDPRVSLSLFLEVEHSGPVCVQTVSRFLVNGRIVRRVSFESIGETSDDSLFLNSIDSQTLAVAMAKAAVDSARSDVDGDRSRQESCTNLETWLGNLVNLAIPNKAASATNVYAAMPPPLGESFIRKLYFFRHGPLLGDAHKASDDVFCVRSLFLGLNTDGCLAMMEPTLMSTMMETEQVGPRLSAVPCDSMALWSQSFVVGDLFNKIVIWRGQNSSALNSPEAELSRYLTVVSDSRFPTPTVVRCTEGSSMARILVSRLNPSHHDLHQHQLSAFPELRTLSQEERDTISKKYPRTDNLSLVQWLRKIRT